MDNIAKTVKVSIIVLYTDISKLEEANYYINRQTISQDIEVVELDNREGVFESAAKGLNHGASLARGDVLIFMHQDIYLWDDSAIEKYYLYLSKHRNHIAGVAGVYRKDNKNHSDIYETKQKIRRILPANGTIMEAYSVDECFFGMTKELWNKLRFDEITCDDWHLYAIDICYNNKLQGGDNVIYPLQICHESLGNSYTKQFSRAVKKLIKKYKGQVRIIYGTTVRIGCGGGSYLLFLLIRRYHMLKRGVIRTLQRKTDND